MRFIDGVIVETVGDEYVAMTPDGAALRISGDAARSVRRMLDHSSTLSEADRDLLLATGVIVSDSGGISRRGILIGSAVSVGAGVVALSLPAAAAAASMTLQGTDIWGEYQAIADPGADYVLVWVYVAKGEYDLFRDDGGYSASAGWPDSLDPLDSWSLVFGSQSVPLGPTPAAGGPSEGVGALTFSAFEDEESRWNQALYDFLREDWVAEKTIQLSITNGSVTVPVSLYASRG
jgi:hypothetical protein